MEEVQRLLDQLVAAGAPGAAAWIQDEHGSVQAGSGVADLRARRPMRPGMHFRAGSLTKSLVATVALQLVAEGRLSLPDTLERWLPTILPYGDRVTIHELLGIMINVLAAPDPVYEAFTQVFRELGARLLWRTP